jgi:hypothetical protein
MEKQPEGKQYWGYSIAEILFARGITHMEGTKMLCPKCRFENREEVKFCEECGAKFELECPACRANIPFGRKFCGECGYDLGQSTEAASLKENEHDPQTSESPPEETIPTRIPAEGERKHVTVLFSDLTGYTAMSEKLDPEEVKEITSRIFGEISKIVASYDGFIEKYAGDAVMAELSEAVENLRKGKGRIFSICGVGRYGQKQTGRGVQDRT